LKSKLQRTGKGLAAADSCAACVVDQQYSSAIFVSLRFHFDKEKIRCPFKKGYYYIILILLFFKLRKSEIVYPQNAEVGEFWHYRSLT
jgi:hypothetical protein